MGLYELPTIVRIGVTCDTCGTTTIVESVKGTKLQDVRLPSGWTSEYTPGSVEARTYFGTLTVCCPKCNEDKKLKEAVQDAIRKVQED